MQLKVQESQEESVAHNEGTQFESVVSNEVQNNEASQFKAAGKKKLQVTRKEKTCRKKLVMEDTQVAVPRSKNTVGIPNSRTPRRPDFLILDASTQQSQNHFQ